MQRSSILAGTRGRLLVATLLGLSGLAPAQTIDTSMARATVGLPLTLTLRVRDFEPGPSTLGRDCLQADVQQGETPAPSQALRWRNAVRTADGDTLVAFDSAQTVQEPLLRVRVALLCGAPFIREFTLLAEPPVQTLAAEPKQAKRPGRAAANRANGQPAPTLPTAAITSAPRAAAIPVALSTRPTSEPLALPEGPLPRLVISPLGDTAVSAALRPAVSTPPRAASGPTSASPLTDAFVRLWQQDMHTVREEQRQTRAVMASMTARLERSERDTWQLWSGLVALGTGAGAATILWRVLAEARLRRMGRSTVRSPTAAQPPPPSSAVAEVISRDTAPDTPPAVPSTTIAQVTEPLRTIASVATPPGQAFPELVFDAPPQAEALPRHAGQEPPGRWSESDFGHPALDETRHAELLAKVDAITAGGYFGTSVAVLENALQNQGGKSAAILLRLLDLYRTLNQAWNHERVSAEIEAIYNVSIPALNSSTEGRSIEEHERTWQHIGQLWGTEAAGPGIAQLLARPTRIEVLDLAAFRDALMLHALCTEGASAADTPPVLSSSDPDPAPSLQWRIQGAGA